MSRRPYTPLRVAFRRPWPTTRRGLKLWMIAVIVGLKGWGWLTDVIPPTTTSALRVFSRGHFGAPAVGLPVVGALMVGLCLIACWSAYCHHGRDRYGYTILGGISWVLTAAYVAGPVFGGPTNTAYQGALTWSLIALFVLICADDPDVRIKDIAR